jgi:hypothetical protein
MALNFNIPMPDIVNSFGKGFGLTDNLMQQILGRNELAQKKAQFEKELAFRKQQEARLGANADLTRQLLQEEVTSAKHKNDPMYGILNKVNQYKALQDYVMGGGNLTGNENGVPSITKPTQETGEGLGAFSSQGLQDQLSTPIASKSGININGVNFDALKKNPMLRGFFKELFGYDPLATSQTPEEKENAALDLFKKKEDIKKESKGGENPTNTVLTQNQQALQGINTVLPMLDDIINNKSKIFGRWDFDPSKKAAYNAKTSAMIDTLIAAQSLPKVQASIDLVEQQIRRATNEGDDAYIERLKELKKDLVARRIRAQNVLKSRKVDTSTPEDFKSMTDEELHHIAGGG